MEFPSIPAPIRWKMFLDFAFWILSMTNCELWLTLFLVFFLRFPVLLTADTFLVWPKSTFVIVFLLWERFVFIFYLSSSWVLLVVLFLIYLKRSCHVHSCPCFGLQKLLPKLNVRMFYILSVLVLICYTKSCVALCIQLASSLVRLMAFVQESRV